MPLHTASCNISPAKERYQASIRLWSPCVCIIYIWKCSRFHVNGLWGHTDCILTLLKAELATPEENNGPNPQMHWGCFAPRWQCEATLHPDLDTGGFSLYEGILGSGRVIVAVPISSLLSAARTSLWSPNEAVGSWHKLEQPIKCSNLQWAWYQDRAQRTPLPIQFHSILSSSEHSQL